MKKQAQKTYNLPTSFLNILSEEEKSVYEDYFNCAATKQLRKKLVEYYGKQIDGSYLKSEKEVKYEIPSWSEYQADAIGYRRAMRDIIKLLK